MPATLRTALLLGTSMALALGACTSSTSLSARERENLDRFRSADRLVAHKVERLLHDYDARLIDGFTAKDLADEAARSWEDMRWRVVGVKFDNKELDATLHKYLAQRTDALTSLTAALSWGGDEIMSMAAFRVQDEVAERTRRALALTLDTLPLTALPPIAAEPPVAFQLPPPAAAGAAYFLSGERLVTLDEKGFRVIATGIASFDVGGGIVWACGHGRVVRWDGKTATEIEPKVGSSMCAAGPDGKLWVLGVGDQVASFDGTRWSVVAPPYDESRLYQQQLLTDGNGRLYLSWSSPDHEHVIAVFEKNGWRELRRGGHINHMFRGGDGNIWVVTEVQHGGGTPNAVAQLTPTPQEPVYIGNPKRSSDLWAVVDAKGVPTVFDKRHHAVVQGNQELRLPAALMLHYVPHGGFFAYDASGRLWFDLADGLSVIDRDGQRHVFPPGSVDGLREPITRFEIIGAGPKLPAPQPVATHTLKGTILDNEEPLANAPLVLCALADHVSSPPCPHDSPQWTTTTDAQGNFTFENVPRFALRLVAQHVQSNEYRGHDLSTTCCGADVTELGVIKVRHSIM